MPINLDEPRCWVILAGQFQLCRRAFYDCYVLAAITQYCARADRLALVSFNGYSTYSAGIPDNPAAAAEHARRQMAERAQQKLANAVGLQEQKRALAHWARHLKLEAFLAGAAAGDRVELVGSPTFIEAVYRHCPAIAVTPATVTTPLCGLDAAAVYAWVVARIDARPATGARSSADEQVSAGRVSSSVPT